MFDAYIADDVIVVGAQRGIRLLVNSDLVKRGLLEGEEINRERIFCFSKTRGLLLSWPLPNHGYPRYSTNTRPCLSMQHVCLEVCNISECAYFCKMFEYITLFIHRIQSFSLLPEQAVVWFLRLHLHYS